VDDSHFPAAWAELCDVLRTTGRPPVIDRRGERPDRPPPRPGDCLVHLGTPEGRWSIAIAGAQVLAPGTVVWALCPGWLRRDRDRLWCQRGVWADRAGQMYLDDFSPPREVTYFANFLTRPGTYGERSDGEPLEAGLGCPQSSCTELAEFVACKVRTRLLAACAGVAVPHSIALTSTRPRGVLVTHRHPHVVVLDGSRLFARGSRDGVDAIHRIHEWIAAPLEQWPDWVDRVVVKPSGLMHLQGRGIRILPRDDPRAIAQAALSLMAGEAGTTFDPGDSVLIDAFVGGEGAALRVRAFVARTDDRRVAALPFCCGYGSADRPISGVSAWPQSIDAVLQNAGIPDAGAAAERLAASLRQAAEATMAAVIAVEPRVPAKPRARTDLLGLDFIVALPGDTRPGQPALCPVMVEVNDHDCTDLAQIVGYARHRPMDGSLGSPQSHLLDVPLRAALNRSQRYRLGGKRLLLVGGATRSKRSVWERARACGVRLVLVESEWPAAELGFGPELESMIVVPQLHRAHTELAEQAVCEAVVGELRERDLAVDGVLCVWEDCAVLGARLAERLGLPGHPVDAQRRAKSKLETRAALRVPLSDTQSSAQPNPATLTLDAVEIRCVADLDGPAARRLGFPAVLRMACGSAAVGTRVVRDRSEAAEHARFLLGLRDDPPAAEARYPGAGFSFGPDFNRLFLCEYVAGNEYDVDAIIFDGELVDAWVTDNGVTDVPCCAEVCAMLPSALPFERQQQLIAAAWLACQRVGLRNGLANVELKLSPFGPKVLDLNARMGGIYIPEWTREVWGLELPEQAMLVACGIRPAGRVLREPRTWLAGVQIYPDQPVDLDQPAALVTRLGDHTLDPYYPEAIANVAFRGSSPTAAVAVAEAGLPRVFRGDPERAAVLANRLQGLLP
jgi:biotin carboxylase